MLRPVLYRMLNHEVREFCRSGMTLHCLHCLIDALQNPWFIVAAVAFSASNRPEGVPRVFEQALQDLKKGGSDKSEELMLAQKMREALFKSGLISGYPKVHRHI